MYMKEPRYKIQVMILALDLSVLDPELDLIQDLELDRVLKLALDLAPYLGLNLVLDLVLELVLDRALELDLVAPDLALDQVEGQLNPMDPMDMKLIQDQLRFHQFQITSSANIAKITDLSAKVS